MSVVDSGVGIKIYDSNKFNCKKPAYLISLSNEPTNYHLRFQTVIGEISAFCPALRTRFIDKKKRWKENDENWLNVKIK